MVGATGNLVCVANLGMSPPLGAIDRRPKRVVARSRSGGRLSSKMREFQAQECVFLVQRAICAPQG